MAREKPGYRDTIAAITQKANDLGFSGVRFTGVQCAEIIGCHRATLYRRYPELTRGGTAADIARAIS